MPVNKNHTQYKTSVYWKKNKDSIKNRIKNNFNLDFLP